MTAPDLGIPEPDRRETNERRLLIDRRSGVDRRDRGPSDERPAERRGAPDRRANNERRAFVERRLSLQSAGDQIRGAIKLLGIAVDAGAIPEKHRRGIDAAMLRLRFALERLDSD